MRSPLAALCFPDLGQNYPFTASLTKNFVGWPSQDSNSQLFDDFLTINEPLL